MSLETRLRETGPRGGGGGSGSSNSAGLAGTGAYYLGTSANSTFPNWRVIQAGTSVSFNYTGSNLFISATTGAAAGQNGWVQFNSQNVLSGNSGLIWDNTGFTLTISGASGGVSTAYQVSAGWLKLATSLQVDYGGTNVSSFGTGLIYSPSGGTVSLLALLARTANSFLAVNSNGYTQEYKTFVAGSSVVINYVNTGIVINALTGGAASSSAGLVGTANYWITWSSDPLLSNEKILTAGSSVVIRTDSSVIYIDALTSGGASNANISTGGFLQLPVQGAKLYSNTSAARIDAGTAVWRLLFSPTTQQYGIWQFILPFDYSGSPAAQVTFSSDSSLSVAKSVNWIIDQWGYSNAQSSIYVDTYASANNTTIALSAGYSAGLIQIITVPLVNTNSFSSGNLIRLRVSSSAGNITGNQELVGLSLFYRAGTQTIASGSAGLQGTGGFSYGLYQPASTSVANLDAISLTSAQYMRVGSTVNVSGRFTADPTLTATKTIFGVSIPIASAFTSSSDCAGIAFSGNVAGLGAEICADQTNDRAQVFWISGDINSQNWSYNFTYQVI